MARRGCQCHLLLVNTFIKSDIYGKAFSPAAACLTIRSEFGDNAAVLSAHSSVTQCSQRYLTILILDHALKKPKTKKEYMQDDSYRDLTKRLKRRFACNHLACSNSQFGGYPAYCRTTSILLVLRINWMRYKLIRYASVVLGSVVSWVAMWSK